MPTEYPIYTLTLQHLRSLDAAILKDQPTSNLGERFRNLPRSGKLLRIQKYTLNLPVQSVYDHILSVAEIADLLFPTLSREKKQILAGYIFAHDLTEILIGDIPAFTSSDHYKIEKTEVNEELAIKRITECLPQETGSIFQNTTSRILSPKPYWAKTFLNTADKMEPILAIWRYIHLYRAQINIDQFLEAMADFFNNPLPTQISHLEAATAAIRFFQKPDKARAYYAKTLDLSEAPELVPLLLQGQVERRTF